MSFVFEPVRPEFNSMILSVIVVFVESSVVAVPCNVTVPLTIKSVTVISPLVKSSTTSTLFLNEPATVAI